MRRLVLSLVVLLGAAAVLDCNHEAGWQSRQRTPVAHSPIRIVVLGDSVAHGAGDEQGLGLPGCLDREVRKRAINARPTMNFGLNGARTFNVIRLLRDPRAREAIARADVIVLSIGGNDLYGDSASRLLSTIWPWQQRQRVLGRVEQVVRVIQHANREGQIYLLGLYNPYRRSRAGEWIETQVNLWDGSLIQRLADTRGVTVVRITDLLRRADRISPLDHFHPGAVGYAAIAGRIADAF